MKVKGKDLIFISRIDSGGLGVSLENSIKLESTENTCRDEEEFELSPLSISKGTYITLGMTSYVVKVLPLVNIETKTEAKINIKLHPNCKVRKNMKLSDDAKTAAREFRRNLGLSLKALRLERGLTQEEVGKTYGVNKGQVSKIESGKKNTSWESTFNYLNAINASIDFTINLNPIEEEDGNQSLDK